MKPSPQLAAVQLSRHASGCWRFRHHTARRPSGCSHRTGRQRRYRDSHSIVIVGIVTCFDAGLYNAVPTHGVHAHAQAGVAVIVIAVVTVFDPGVNKAVAARRNGTVFKTRIGIVDVPIVTCLGADLYEAIAAGGPHAGIRAVIGVVRIATPHRGLHR